MLCREPSPFLCWERESCKAQLGNIVFQCNIPCFVHDTQRPKCKNAVCDLGMVLLTTINQLLIKIVPEKINKTFSTNHFLWKSLIRFLHFQQLLVNIKFLDYEGNHITYSRHLLSWKFKGNTFVTLHIICFYSMKEHTTLELVVQSTNRFYDQMTVTLSEKIFLFWTSFYFSSEALGDISLTLYMVSLNNGQLNCT